MNILNFNEKFPDEQSCVEFFKQKRLKEGVLAEVLIDGFGIGHIHFGSQLYRVVITEQTFKCF